MVNMLLR